ncbi:hypothetical protein [Vibrio sp. CyArs1]|uniref:hypothetical protein n=1 Tax=Vibrio sp. CyArs1 TaxID=2682577 RepID=UPI001F0538C0|nr:hypothetical protein [Vibrio sp. CyArs1]
MNLLTIREFIEELPIKYNSFKTIMYLDPLRKKGWAKNYGKSVMIKAELVDVYKSRNWNDVMHFVQTVPAYKGDK